MGLFWWGWPRLPLCRQGRDRRYFQQLAPFWGRHTRLRHGVVFFTCIVLAIPFLAEVLSYRQILVTSEGQAAAA